MLLSDSSVLGCSGEADCDPMYKSLLPFNISISVLMFADLQQINLAALHQLLSRNWAVCVCVCLCVCEQGTDHKRGEKQLLVNACIIEFVPIMPGSDESRYQQRALHKFNR
jgi:hypothetical protein